MIGVNGVAPYTNVFWFHLNGSGVITSSDLTTLVQAIGTKYATRFGPFISNAATITDAFGVLWNAPDEPLAVAAHVGGGGSATGQFLPASIASCIGWFIPAHYRGGHPRTYLPGVTATMISTQKLFAAAHITGLENAANLFHSDVEALTAPNVTSVSHGVISYVRDKAWRTPPVFYRITSARVDQRIDTQRRRLGKDIP